MGMPRLVAFAQIVCAGLDISSEKSLTCNDIMATWLNLGMVNVLLQYFFGTPQQQSGSFGLAMRILAQLCVARA